MATGELAAGPGLEIGFKGNSLGLVAEGNAGFNAPGASLCGVGDPPLVVTLQPFGQIGCNPGVMGVWILFAYEEVDVVIVGWHAKP